MANSRRNKEQASKLACLFVKRIPWKFGKVVTHIIPIDYKIYFRVSVGMRLTVLGGDLVWVPSLVIGSSRSSLVVLWGTMVEMVELHVVG